MQATHKTCQKCKVSKPKSAFGRYEKGLKRNCDTCPTRKIIKGHGLHPSQYPCVGCGKPFEVYGYGSRTTQRKYCSHECSRVALRRATYFCNRCKQDKPYEDFDRKGKSRNRKAYCRDCGAIALAGTGTSDKPRPSSDQMFRSIKNRASREGFGFALTRAEVRRMYRSMECCLCGSAVVTIRCILPGTINRNNVRGYCRRCRAFLCHHAAEEILSIASDIKSHQSSKEASNAAHA